MPEVTFSKALRLASSLRVTLNTYAPSYSWVVFLSLKTPKHS
ncbi:hypothetical protein B595_0937 [Chlamydia psittaci 84/55]|nr:hypothetical protein B595_0937 [Chlamydia psittaci 84/55]